jgi:hypothetical protein
VCLFLGSLMHLFAVDPLQPSSASDVCDCWMQLQVRGKSKDDQYIVFPEHYCSCKAFQFDVVGRSDAPFVSVQIIIMFTLAR